MFFFTRLLYTIYAQCITKKYKKIIKSLEVDV